MSVSQIPRCPTHGTVLNPKGECTLCNRRSVTPPASGVPLWAKALGGATGLVALIGLGSFVYSYFRESPDAATGAAAPQEPSDGRYRIHAALPRTLGRRAHIEATYTRRVSAVQRAGGQARNATPSAAYFRLDAIQRIAAVDPQDGVTTYEYQVSSLRIGTTSADARDLLHDAVVRVQPRPTGEAVITVAGERIEPALGGTYEAFRTMTPVYLGLDEDQRYGLDTRRAPGDSWTVTLENEPLRRSLQLNLHMQDAAAEAHIRFNDVEMGLGALDVGLSVTGARPRNIGMDGTVESYTLSARERLSLPVRPEGRRDFESTTTSTLRVRVPGDDGLSRLFDFELIELRHQTNTPLD
ncbi:MAG: hypothetical protein R3B40_15075 [Polyangiales bacterium]|nr:hypothetical protein [Myxococcales bacterium]MCB9658282.1 hypothetical protein [Sandaracinaceae bacterium]